MSSSSCILIFPKVPPDPLPPPILYGYKIANFPETLDHIPKTAQCLSIPILIQLDMESKQQFFNFFCTLLETIFRESYLEGWWWTLTRNAATGRISIIFNGCTYHKVLLQSAKPEVLSISMGTSGPPRARTLMISLPNCIPVVITTITVKVFEPTYARWTLARHFQSACASSYINSPAAKEIKKKCWSWKFRLFFRRLKKKHLRFLPKLKLCPPLEMCSVKCDTIKGWHKTSQ